MNRKEVVQLVKEKGPAVGFGAIVGAAVVTTWVYRKRIMTRLRDFIGRRGTG